jgi:hypothetical protein
VTYEEFQRHVGKAGLTLTEFAGMVRMSRVSISNLSRKGEVPGHLAIIASLLGEMAEQRVEFRTVLSRIDVKPKKPRGPRASNFGRGDTAKNVDSAYGSPSKGLGI